MTAADTEAGKPATAKAEREALRMAAYYTYVGWLGYFKDRNINTLLEFLRKTKAILEQVDNKLQMVLGTDRANLRKVEPKPYQESNDPWTKKETESLYKLRTEGLSYRQISEKMGRSLASVKCKLEFDRKRASNQ